MNREIKFRGKRIDNGEWVYGYYFKFGKEHRICNGYGEIWSVDPETVGQFTGLKDKDGKEIYEGDIIKWDVYEEDVRFTSGVYRLGGWELLCRVDKSWLCVIGNIHDNPELMEEINEM